MQPAKAETPFGCSIRQQLAQEFATAARLYAEAVVLVTSLGAMPNHKYTRLRNTVREAHARAEIARVRFEEHVESHRCLAHPAVATDP
jgi:hypothetical protein